MEIDIQKIIQLPRKERWQYFFATLKERGIPRDESPADYPEDVWQLFKEISDQDYRDANNGENPKPPNLRNSELFKRFLNQ